MKDGFDKAKDVAQIIALVAIPVVLTIIGWWLQSSIKDREIHRDYVQLSLQILSAEKNDESNELRNWARQVLAAYSPVPFTEQQILQLDGLVLYPPPPPSVIQPPQTETRLRQLLFAPDATPTSNSPPARLSSAPTVSDK